MKKHLKVCPNQEVKCKYYEFGCHVEIRSKYYSHHLSLAMEKHLNLVAEYAKNERSERIKLEQEIGEIKSALNALNK